MEKKSLQILGNTRNGYNQINGDKRKKAFWITSKQRCSIGREKEEEENLLALKIVSMDRYNVLKTTQKTWRKTEFNDQKPYER